jgi:hypothetical protein
MTRKRKKNTRKIMLHDVIIDLMSRNRVFSMIKGTFEACYTDNSESPPLVIPCSLAKAIEYVVLNKRNTHSANGIPDLLIRVYKNTRLVSVANGVLSPRDIKLETKGMSPQEVADMVIGMVAATEVHEL